MSETLQPPGQPFTFSGVARYASARFSRLLGVAFLFAILPAIVSGWLGARCWWPVITEAVGSLPDQGQIGNASLQLPEKDARLLAANQFLSFELSLGDSPPENAPVDIAFQFGRFELMVTSLFGDAALPYPESWNIPLNRNVLWPLWGAWKGPILGAFVAATLIALILSWFALALLYAPVVLTIGGIAGRDLTFNRAWKLAVAAQWPASLLMTFTLALYSTGEIGLLFVIIMFAAHFLPSLLNILIAPLFVPKVAPRTKGNPFNPEKKRARPPKNPFHSRRADD